MDEERVGLKVQVSDAIPPKTLYQQRRLYFDTREFGKSASGHDFPNELTEEERGAVLEYLKTL